MIEVPRHFLRIGSHAEKEYFLSETEYYDGFIINANLAVGTAAASASLATVLFEHGKSFIIDPWTYVFGLRPALLRAEKIDKKSNNRNFKVKDAYVKLAEKYTWPEKSRVGEVPVTPNDFSEPNVLDRFCKGVLSFQRDFVQNEFEGDSVFSEGEDTKPFVLLAPYFYAPDREWLSINQKLIHKSIDIAKDMGMPLFGVVFCPIDILRDQEFREQTLKYFGNLNVNGFCIWISGMDEHFLSKTDIIAFAEIVRSLSKTNGGIPVINMYGGYLSAIFKHIGLDSFSHGIGYGEDKEVEPVIGGLPSAKFYIPPLHERFLFSEVGLMVNDFNSERYYKEICECGTCKKEIGKDFRNFKIKFLEMKPSSKVELGSRGADRLYATGEAVRLSRLHFLKVRHKEIKDVDKSTLKEIAKDLSKEHNNYSKLIGAPAIGYLKRWSDALGKLSN